MNAAQALLNIGAVQFGRFVIGPDHTEPVHFNLRLLASYPAALRSVADEIAPLISRTGKSHLLAMPGALPLALAVSLQAEMPLVYPTDLNRIEGAFDYNVPTVLLTDVYRDGAAEAGLTAHANKQGLDVEATVAVFDLGIGSVRPVAWRDFEAFVRDESGLPSAMQRTIQIWLTQIRIS